MEINELFWVRLHFSKGIGSVGIRKVWEYYQAMTPKTLSPCELIELAELRQTAESFITSWHFWQPEKLADYLVNQNYVTLADDGYPKMLHHIYDPPAVLFYQGDLQLLTRNLLGVVGARQASPYGKAVVNYLVTEMVQAGFVIVSGLAQGIDGASHWQAINCGGKTIAVLGNGLDYCYPKNNQALQEQMAKEHLLISEYPAGVKPKRHHFPLRNRIISGLCLGICVIEAKEKSGSLITAQQALEAGKEVFAVPGDILKKQSNGCHQLIQEGAKCVCSSRDILEEIPGFLLK